MARILVVDDEEHAREVLQRGLTQAGYACTTACSAAEAAERLEQEELDLVLLDINMPGKSGIEFLLDIRTAHPDIAVVMLTAIADVATAVKAMREGAYDYATKPFDLAELTVRVERALSRRALLDENKAYQRKLEETVGERTSHLKSRINELSALNSLFQSHLDIRDEAESAVIELTEGLVRVADEMHALTNRAASLKADIEKTKAKVPARSDQPHRA